MANILPDIGSGLVAKLEKDELYTFLYGFGIGLVYYIVLFMKSGGGGQYVFIFATMFEKIAVYVCLGLLSTLLLFTFYVLIATNINRYARSQINNKDSGTQKIDVSERRIFLYLLYDRFYSLYQSSIHQKMLQISAIILLAPVPWLFGFFIYKINSMLSAGISAILLVVALILISICKKTYIDFAKIDHLIAYRMIKVTNNAEEYINNHNYLVDEYAKIEAQNKCEEPKK